MSLFIVRILSVNYLLYFLFYKKKLYFRHPMFKRKVSWSSKAVIVTRREGEKRKREWISAIMINLVININGTYM